MLFTDGYVDFELHVSMKRFFAVAVSAALVLPAVVLPALLIENTEVRASISSKAKRDLDKIGNFLEKEAKDAIKDLIIAALLEVRETAIGKAKRTVDRMRLRIQGLDDPEVEEVIDVIAEEAEEAGPVIGDTVIAELVPVVSVELAGE